MPPARFRLSGGSPNTSRVATQECETGSAGIGVITQLAEALAVDPAELFTPDLPGGQLQRATLTEISSRLASLSESELLWLKSLIEAALRPKG